MKLMKSFAIVIFLMLGSFLTISTAYAYGIEIGCYSVIEKKDADQHQAGHPLKGRVGDPGPHHGEEAYITLPIDKNFHQLKQGDLLYSHGVVHTFVRTEQQADGTYKLELKPTKLVIDQKLQIKHK
jgi:hypothetical protein